jgi:large subunit ribosomal protein L9
MKIILREDVVHLGDRGEVVSVAAGYARNYLLPKGLAFEATPGNLKQIGLRRKRWEARDVEEVGVAEQLAARLADLELETSHKAGEGGTLYGAVTNVEIAGLLAARGVEIDRRKILLSEPIKSLGDHEIEIKLHRKVVGRIKLRVVAEEAPES